MSGIDRDPSLYLFTRTLADGRVVDVVALALGRARIILSPAADSFFWSDGW